LLPLRLVLSTFRDKPAGTIRITTVEHAAKTILCPALSKLLPAYPDITVESIVDYGLAEVVADRLDAGVCLGEQVAKDMIAVRIGPDIPMAIVGSPHYFRQHPPPTNPDQLVGHRCINLRLPTSGTLNAWRLVKGGRETRVRVDGPLIFNTIDLILDAAIKFRSPAVGESLLLSGRRSRNRVLTRRVGANPANRFSTVSAKGGHRVHPLSMCCTPR
jgi:LysR family transcriptional regulator, regulator of peptidoglycan recycling